MSDIRVANTILEQLGGNHFKVMTGASKFIFTDNSLMIRLPGGGGFCKSGINKVVITLMPSDTYKVDFYRMRGHAIKLIESCEDIYCDALVPCFERVTGLRTSLGRAA
jgi:hypothetical protein